jgi:hypothetical protein
MSELSKNITAFFTDERYILPHDFISMARESKMIPGGVKVRFTATFGTEYIISEEVAKEAEVIEYTTNKVRKQVIETVFGEFRKPLMNVEHLLYQRKYDEAMSALRKLEKQMFYE